MDVNLSKETIHYETKKLLINICKINNDKQKINKK